MLDLWQSPAYVRHYYAWLFKRRVDFYKRVRSVKKPNSHPLNLCWKIGTGGIRCEVLNHKAVDTAYLPKRLYEIYDQELDILERDNNVVRHHVEDVMLPYNVPSNWVGKKTFYVKTRSLNAFKKVIRKHWQDFNNRFPTSEIKFK